MSVKLITPVELYRLHQESGAISVVDVREVSEFAELSTAIARNFPLSTLDPQHLRKSYTPEDPIYMLCRSGARSGRAAEMLVAAGYSTVYNVTGGMLAWVASGLPVIKR